jgi:hypothetical protein
MSESRLRIGAWVAEPLKILLLQVPLVDPISPNGTFVLISKCSGGTTRAITEANMAANDLPA